MNEETPCPEDPPEPEPEKVYFTPWNSRRDPIDELRRKKLRDPPKGLPASVALPVLITVRELATALGLKPFELVRTLLEFNVFASVNAQLRFDLASALCSYYGVAASGTD